MELLIAASLFGVASLTLIGLAAQSNRSRELAMGRLLRAKGGPQAAAEAKGESSPSPSSLWAWLEKLRPWLGPLGENADRESYGPLRAKLAEAGFRSRTAVGMYVLTRVALGLTLSTGTLALGAITLPGRTLLFAGIAAGAVGFLLPTLYVSLQRRKRRQAIFESLPDALDLMVVCVEAGLGLGATLHRVAQEFRSSSPVLAAEFQLVVLETQAGKSLGAALRALGERTQVVDLQSLMSALVQTERLGTSIADTMRVQSDSIRTKRLHLAEELAQKAPVKMLFPALLIFAAMLIVTIVPAALGLMSALTE